MSLLKDGGCRLLVIDCDTGVDDARAIMMAVRSNVWVKAITCVSGNCSLVQAVSNTSKVLHICDRTEIPIYKGATTSLLGRSDDASYFHGSDGLGDSAAPISTTPPNITSLQSKHAVLAMIDIANKYPGLVTLVCLAPLTNVAMAIRMDPTFGDKLERVIIMGGNMIGAGNHRVCAEYNFSVDPEAADIVLNELGCKITLIPWDTCLRSGLPWGWFEKLISGQDKISMFHKDISSYDIRRRNDGDERFVACDPVAMMVALNPDSALKKVEYYCRVELQGSLTRGQLVIDRENFLKKKPNVEIITSIDKSRLRLFYEMALR